MTQEIIRFATPKEEDVQSDLQCTSVLSGAIIEQERVYAVVVETKYIPIDVNIIARYLGIQYSPSVENPRVYCDLVRQMGARSILSWRKGDEEKLLARNLNGDEVEVSLLSAKERTKTQDNEQLIEYLNKNHTTSRLIEVIRWANPEIKPTIAGPVAIMLGKFAAGLVFKFLGGLLISKIFPDNTVTLFQQLYKDLSKVIQQEIDAAHMANIQGAINGTASYMRNQYEPAKERGFPRAQLYDMVDREISKLSQEIGKLKTARYREVGFQEYILGVCLLLAMTQEKAYVDPHNFNPIETAGAESVRREAQENFNYGLETWNIIKKKRREAVIPFFWPATGSQCMFRPQPCYAAIDIIDQWPTMAFFESVRPAYDQAAYNAANEHLIRGRDYVVWHQSELFSEGGVESLLGSWELLIKHPLGYDVDDWLGNPVPPPFPLND